MDTLRSFTSKLTTSTPGGKLSKAFKFDKDHNVMSMGRTGDPFNDGPMLEEPSLPKSRLWIHCACLFITFLAICTMGGVAGFQAKWVGVSGGTGFTLFILLLSFLLSAFLVITPLVYDRWDRLKRPAQFLQVSRSTLILHAFGTGIMFMASLIVTVGSWTAPGCKDPANDPHADLGDEFQKGLTQWCTTKRASAIFDWMAFACWLALLVLSGLSFHRERRQNRREPSFIPPTTSDPYAQSAGIGPGHYANVNVQDFEGDAAGAGQYDRYDVEPKPVDAYGYDLPYDQSQTYQTSQAQTLPPQAYDPAPVEQSVGYTRPQMGGRMGTGLSLANNDGTSRTMQLAANASDPYAAIRSSLVSGQANSFSQPATTTGYDQPQYAAYR